MALPTTVKPQEVEATSMTSMISTAVDEQAMVFRLLDLPPEIWSRICKLAVTEEDPIDISPVSYLEHTKLHGLEPALTRVCRCIRAETIDTYYRNNVFEARYTLFFNIRSLRSWLRTLGPDKRRKLECLNYRTNSEEPQVDRYLECFDLGVTEVEITDVQYGSDGYEIRNKIIFT